MKKRSIFAITASLVGLVCLTANAQTTAVTKPVGYDTITIRPNQFNPAAVGFAKKVLATGEIDGVGNNFLTDVEGKFLNTFAGVTFFDRDFNGPDEGTPNLVVEITSGPNAGLNTEVTSFTGKRLITLDNLKGIAVAGDTYVVRESLTIADIFGPANEAMLAAGDGRGTTDKVWIHREGSWNKLSEGTWDNVFYHPGNGGTRTAGWKARGRGNVDVADLPVYFTAGFFVQRVGDTGLDIVVSGHVRVDSAWVSLETGHNLLSRLFPVGATLDNSGLDALNHGWPNNANTDIVWMPKPGGAGWDKYYYHPGNGTWTEGWKLKGGGANDRGDTPLTPGIRIERREGATNLVLTPDLAIYDNL